MLVVRFTAALALAALVQIGGVSLDPRFHMALDPFLVLVLFNGLRGSTLAGLLGGCVAGLTADALSGTPFGLNGVVDTILGYVTAYAVQRLVIQRTTGVLLLFTFAAAAQQGLLAAVATALQVGPESATMFWPLVKVGTTGLAGAAVYILSTRWRTRVERWQTQRVSKLRFRR